MEMHPPQFCAHDRFQQPAKDTQNEEKKRQFDQILCSVVCGGSQVIPQRPQNHINGETCENRLKYSGIIVENEIDEIGEQHYESQAIDYQGSIEFMIF